MSDPRTNPRTNPETNPGTNPEAGGGSASAAPEPARGGWLATPGRKAAAALAAVAILAAGAAGVQAAAESKAYGHFRLAAAEGGGWPGHGGWHGRDHKRLSEMSEQEVADRVERMVRHMAIEIDATDEQETRIIGLMTGLAADIKPLAERMQATRGEISGLLTATTIDREALERLRAARLAEADRISKTLVDTIAEVAETLTPEQRAELAEMIRERSEMRGRHRRG